MIFNWVQACGVFLDFICNLQFLIQLLVVKIYLKIFFEDKLQIVFFSIYLQFHLVRIAYIFDIVYNYCWIYDIKLIKYSEGWLLEFKYSEFHFTFHVTPLYVFAVYVLSLLT